MRTLPTGTVSFLFTDIQGSTELLHHLGDQAYGEVLLTHQRLLRAAFSEHEGTEVDTTGDAFFVAFPRAWNAVAAATAAQRALATHPWAEGVTVRVRMGIHTGEPTMAGDHYVGLDVHRAARIVATGYGGQVLLSERSQAMTQATLPEGVNVRDLGEHRLKDIPRPERIYQLVIPGLPADFPPLKSLEVLVTNLPALQRTSFVGREREMAEIKGQLGAVRLLTLLGPGGTGKTRLALEVGAGVLEQFPRGVWLAELAPLTNPELVVQAVASVFNVREVAGRPLLDSLVDYLKPRELLLILDNCEHLIEATAHLADALLRGCPQVRLLATSREPLSVHGEGTYRVPPLSRPDPTKPITADRLGEFEAARLFIERAVLGNPKFSVTDANAPAVARVVARLDGIPLAVELAAARVKVLSVEQIAGRLDDMFRVLTGGARAGLPHHQTLRATIGWSHDLLSETERALFHRLAVFAGGFSLEAAEAICADAPISEYDVLDLLSRLVDKSLVLTDSLEGDVRYRLLETIRAYSREKLVQAGQEAAIQARHLHWYLALAEGAEPSLRGPEQLVWLDRLQTDHDNLRAALDWSTSPQGDGAAALRLGWALHPFWAMRGFLREGREWLAAALNRRDAAPPAVQGRALYAAGLLAHRQGDYRQAEELTQAGLDLFRAAADSLGVALSLNNLGRLARHRGDYQQAVALIQEALTMSQEAGLTWPRAEAFNILGLTAESQGDYEEAKAVSAQGLALWRELGDKWGLAGALRNLGNVAKHQGDYEGATVRHLEALVLSREMGNKFEVATLLISLGTLAMHQGQQDEATRLFEESLMLSRELGHRAGVAASLGNLGIVAYHKGEYVRARSCLDEARTLWAGAGARGPVATSLTVMGKVAYSQGDHHQAIAHHLEGLRLFRDLGDRPGIAESLEGVANAAVALRQFGRAARLFGAAEALREALTFPLPPAERAGHDAAVATLQEAMGEASFRVSWAEGRVLPLEEAIGDALKAGEESASRTQEPARPQRNT